METNGMPESSIGAFLEKRLDDICECFREAIDREVETLRQQGLPIYVEEDGQVVDLQQAEGEK